MIEGFPLFETDQVFQILEEAEFRECQIDPLPFRNASCG